ncbi:hypothetical protein N0V88_002846 [Collariella sp. IMI 366227]|nr:hypothetical protein N0V88_002846 [Collariella sp. IMI 366227]
MYFMTADQTTAVAGLPVTPAEQVQLNRTVQWGEKGRAYGNEHGTQPSTISLFLSTNTLAMLAWMGEKFVEWSKNRSSISLNTILFMTSFYWFTESFGRGMWAYRELMGIVGGGILVLPLTLTKLLGYPDFRTEVLAFPRAWAEHLFPNLVLYKAHDKSSHCAVSNQNCSCRT